MYERILVPLDGSKVGEAALVHVEKLVSKMAPKVKTEVKYFTAKQPFARGGG